MNIMASIAHCAAKSGIYPGLDLLLSWCAVVRQAAKWDPFVTTIICHHFLLLPSGNVRAKLAQDVLALRRRLARYWSVLRLRPRLTVEGA